MKQVVMLFCVSAMAALVGCAPSRHSGVDPTFQPYLDEFTRDMVVYNAKGAVDVGIQFGDISAVAQVPNGEYKAFCGAGTGQVTVDRVIWAQMSELDRKMTIYHELGHCVLRRGEHNNTEKPSMFGARSPIPVSIMNHIPPVSSDMSAAIEGPSVYEKELLAELFSINGNPAN